MMSQEKAKSKLMPSQDITLDITLLLHPMINSCRALVSASFKHNYNSFHKS